MLNLFIALDFSPRGVLTCETKFPNVLLTPLAAALVLKAAVVRAGS